MKLHRKLLTMSRQVVKKVQNQERSEGVGAKVRRSIGFRDVFKHFAFNTITHEDSYDGEKKKMQFI